MRNKKSKAILIISFILTLFLWIIIWITTGLNFYNWKFWVVLFSILGLMLLNDIRQDVMEGKYETRQKSTNRKN